MNALADVYTPADLSSLDREYPLTDAQVRRLYEDGWTRLSGLLDKPVLEAIRSRLVRMKERPHVITGSYRAGDKPAQSGLDENMQERSAASLQPNILHDALSWNDPFFLSVSTSRRVGGVATRLMMKSEALLVQDVSFIKPVGAGASLMHQDFAYWPFDRKGSITIWIALVDMTPEMAPLQYVQQSHREGPLGMSNGVDIRDMYPHLWDRSLGGGTALSAGDAQVHWDLTVHGANAHTGGPTREAYAVRFAPVDTIYTGTGHPHFDTLCMNVGDKLGSCPKLPRVSSFGLVK
jgi:ectoine hydroxylase-related dioxygenase (phytanoyl-CoA dioxygenase family)